MSIIRATGLLQTKRGDEKRTKVGGKKQKQKKEGGGGGEGGEEEGKEKKQHTHTHTHKNHPRKHETFLRVQVVSFYLF